MLIALNGRPGVGKLTVGRILAAEMGARLLDAHTLYNMAFALTEKGSEAFQRCVWSLRALATEHVRALPADVPVITTDAVFADSDWGNAIWDDTRKLAQARGGPFLVVVLDCAQDENERRLGSPERMGKRKPTDGTLLSPNRYARRLIDRDADARLVVDTTDLAPQDSAAQIAAWVAEQTGQ